MAEYGPDSIPIASLSSIQLTNYQSKVKQPASDLWKSQTSVIMVVRRPGCSLCRSQAKELADLRPDLSKLNVKLYAVSWQADSLDEFISQYFGGETSDVFLDLEKGFYKALGGGQVCKKSLLGIFSTRVWSSYRAANHAGVSGNFSGDGSNLGGVLVVGPDGLKFVFKEVAFGDKVTRQSLLDACR